MWTDIGNELTKQINSTSENKLKNIKQYTERTEAKSNLEIVKTDAK